MRTLYKRKYTHNTTLTRSDESELIIIVKLNITGENMNENMLRYRECHSLHKGTFLATPMATEGSCNTSIMRV